MEMFNQSGGMANHQSIQQWIVQQLKAKSGVTEVKTIVADEVVRQNIPSHGLSMHLHGGESRGLHFHHGEIVKLTMPESNIQEGVKTVSIYSSLTDTTGSEIGKLWVQVRFDYLLQDLLEFGWWQSERAFIVDSSGRFILHTTQFGEDSTTLGETNDPFELRILEQIRSKPLGTLYDRGQPPKNVAGFYNIGLANWSIVLVAPGDELLSPLIHFRTLYVFGILISVMIVVALTRYHLNQIIRPIQKLTQATQAVAKEKYDILIVPRTSDEIGQLTKGFNAMVEGLREREVIRNTFGRYIDHDIAQQLLKHPETTRLGGDKHAVAILMVDIRGFTSLAESMTSEAIITLLNHFFSHMIDIINKYHGIIVDFYGDGLLAFFDPANRASFEAAGSAVECGLAMQERMAALRKEPSISKRYPNIEIGVGLNFGEVVVGNIGSEERAKYGIVGSAVNATDRIQRLAEGGQVVISESLKRLLDDRVEIKKQFSKTLEGFSQPLKLYVVSSYTGDP